LNQDYTRLCQALGYRFKQEDYLTTALTHRSAGTPHNERLEFLGDALLSCIMAEALFERFPASREGELTRLRANLVKRDTLVKIAQRLELGQYADGVEAIIGAIYRDSGMQTCQSVVLQLWEKSLSNLSLRQIKDPKTRLQEYLQAKQQALPVYRVLAIGGTPHAQQFKVECLVPGLPQPTYGGGESRRRAEQSAAAQALGVLNVE